MLSVGDMATKAMLRALDEAEGDTVFRLFVAPEGYALKLDSPSDEDRMIESEDRAVPAVAPEVDELLSEVVLDVEGDNEDLSGLTLRAAGETSR